jgi:hypothetical protein
MQGAANSGPLLLVAVNLQRYLQRISAAGGFWRTIPVSAYEGCMIQGPESSSRKLAWVQGQSVVGWGCSECAWVFSPSGPPTGKSLDEIKRNFQVQLSKEFASHACAEHHLVRAAKLSS